MRRGRDCQWDATPCGGGTTAGAEGEGYCKPGHTGYLCQLCTDEGAYFSEDSVECLECPAESAIAGKLSGGAVGALLLCVLLYLAARRLYHAYVRHAGVEGAARRWRCLDSVVNTGVLWQSKLRSVGVGAYLKIIFGFAQCVQVVPQVYCAPPVRSPPFTTLSLFLSRSSHRAGVRCVRQT